MVEENLGKNRADWPLSLVFHVHEEIPEELSTIIGDAVHNLRSSLDLLLCALVRANGGSDDRVQFPIARNKDALDEAFVNGKVALAGAPVEQFIRSLNPYGGEGGNWILRTVHDLDRLDKHRLIISVGAASDFERVFVGVRWERSMVLTMPGFRWTGLEDGAKFVDIRPEHGAEVGKEAYAAFSIAFGQGQPASTCPVIDTLERILVYIRDNIVSNFVVRDVETED